MGVGISMTVNIVANHTDIVILMAPSKMFVNRFKCLYFIVLFFTHHLNNPIHFLI
jgi:hypothetical protein